MRTNFLTVQTVALCTVIALSVAGCATTATPAPHGKSFASPEAAADVLLAATKNRDQAALADIFGPDMGQLAAGDPRQRDIDLQRFAAALARDRKWTENKDHSLTLHAGPTGWEFPAPLVKDSKGWHFDTATGIEVVISRRIGRNELDAITVSKAYLKAQMQFAALDADKTGKRQFATKLKSAPGRHDGLYWPDVDGAPLSPLGPLVAEASQEVVQAKGAGPASYRGYCYKILPGKSPTGDDVTLLAWPAQYGDTGIMSFKTTLNGQIVQKSLGDSSKVNPESVDLDSGWKPL